MWRYPVEDVNTLALTSPKTCVFVHNENDLLKDSLQANYVQLEKAGEGWFFIKWILE